jgi:hypothetical protein
VQPIQPAQQQVDQDTGTTPQAIHDALKAISQAQQEILAELRVHRQIMEVIAIAPTTVPAAAMLPIAHVSEVRCAGRVRAYGYVRPW